MNPPRIVGIAQLATCRSPEKLVCLGLGSCVAVMMCDLSLKMGGIVHVLLPKAPNNCDREEKYADTGTRKLFKEMVVRGAHKEKLVAKLVGGAQMFTALNLCMADIGRENSFMARKVLGELGVRIAAEDLYGHRGRNITLDPADGFVTVQTTFGPTKVI
jgi:chemotaxis protein CheD